MQRRIALSMAAVAGLAAGSCKTAETQPPASEVQSTPAGRSVLSTNPALLSNLIWNDRAGWLEKVSYRNAAELIGDLTPEPGCSVMNFFIEMGPARTDIGHTAVSIDYDFYDYGPRGTDEWRKATIGEHVQNTRFLRNGISFLGWGDASSGTIAGNGDAWWDLPTRAWKAKDDGTPDYLWDQNKYKTTDDIGLIDVLGNIKHLADGMTTIMVPVHISKAQADAMRQWWGQCYVNADKFNGDADASDDHWCAQYRIPGWHCTSTSIHSFEATEQFGDAKGAGWGTNIMEAISSRFDPATGAVSPLHFASGLLDHNLMSHRFLYNYTHRCGTRKRGKVLKAGIIVLGEEIKNDARMKTRYIDPSREGGLIAWLKNRKAAGM